MTGEVLADLYTQGNELLSPYMLDSIMIVGQKTISSQFAYGTNV